MLQLYRLPDSSAEGTLMSDVRRCRLRWLSVSGAGRARALAPSERTSAERVKKVDGPEPQVSTRALKLTSCHGRFGSAQIEIRRPPLFHFRLPLKTYGGKAFLLMLLIALHPCVVTG